MYWVVGVPSIQLGLNFIHTLGKKTVEGSHFGSSHQIHTSQLHCIIAKFLHFETLWWRYGFCDARTTIMSVNVASTQSGWKECCNIPCQIYCCKDHGALNCYNCLNATKFPLIHGLKMSISVMSEVEWVIG